MYSMVFSAQQYRIALECESVGLPVKLTECRCVPSLRGEEEGVPIPETLLQTETWDKTTEK